MSGKTPALHLQQDHIAPNQSFFSWIRDQSALYVSQILGVLGFISFLAGLIYYVFHNPIHEPLDLKVIQGLVHVGHIIIISIFIIILITLIDENGNGSYRVGMVYRKLFQAPIADKEIRFKLRTSRQQLKRFKVYFLLFWIGMLVLYIAFALKLNLQETEIVVEHKFESTFDAFAHVKFEFFTFALNNLGLLFIFWCFIVLILPSNSQSARKKQKLLRNFSSLVILLITISFPLLIGLVDIKSESAEVNLIAYITIFNAISGTLNALVLALLIARLDSKLIGLPSWLISVLYFYSAVQPLFVAFEQKGEVFEIIKTSVLIVVFLFKIYFFLIIVYVLQTGRMLNYMFCFPTLNKHVDAVFENQFEICVLREHKDYRFLIRKENQQIYSSTNHYLDMEACLESIADLRKFMTDIELYKRNFSGGSHWVQVQDNHNRVICSSKDLKSEEESDDLIHESIEKIPYCKLNF